MRALGHGRAIWPIVGGLAMAAGAVLLIWARQPESPSPEPFPIDSPLPSASRGNAKAKGPIRRPAFVEPRTIALMLARTPSRPRE